MITPNLDAIQHWQVELLARFPFSIEYQKGQDNASTAALHHITSKLDPETVKSILDGVTMGMTKRVDVQDSAVAEADEEIYKPVQETAILARATQSCINLHVTDWVTAQQEDPILKTMIEWISNQKVQDLKNLLGGDANTKDGKTILWEWKKLILYQGALYHCHTPMSKLEEVLQFVVPMAHWVTAMNGCHWDAGHQGQQQTLCLLHDWFWQPGMATQMQKAISNCEWYIQHDGSHAKPQCDQLLHTDFTSIVTTMELDQSPNVVSLLVFCNHFTKYIMANVTPDQTAKTLAKFLWQGYISIIEHQPSSWVTQEPALKATLSESLASLLTYGRSGFHLTMLKLMDRWNELIKHWCAW